MDTALSNETQSEEVIERFSVLLIVSWRKDHISVLISLIVANPPLKKRRRKHMALFSLCEFL